LDEFLADWSV
jgi:putative transposase